MFIRVYIQALCWSVKPNLIASIIQTCDRRTDKKRRLYNGVLLEPLGSWDTYGIRNPKRRVLSRQQHFLITSTLRLSFNDGINYSSTTINVMAQTGLIHPKNQLYIFQMTIKSITISKYIKHIKLKHKLMISAITIR